MAPGTCLVVAASASPLAVLGANGARVAARRGAVGAVVDGAVRDVRALDALGLPVWLGPCVHSPTPAAWSASRAMSR